jgi:hypothetical protein
MFEFMLDSRAIRAFRAQIYGFIHFAFPFSTHFFQVPQIRKLPVGTGKVNETFLGFSAPRRGMKNGYN